MMNLFLEVLKEGQREGVLNPNVRAGILLDFIMGFVQRSFVMWMSRGQSGSLTAQSNALFELVWRAMEHPERTNSQNGSEFHSAIV